MRFSIWGPLALLGATCFASSATAGEANTHFAVLVPANNNNNGRHSTLVVTSHSDGAEVVVRDTDEDGDDDDSISGTLNKGESFIVRIRDGAVNDDAGGKWDGDRFVIDSTLPVTVMLQTRSDWQHDWVPAEGQTMIGQEFFVHGIRADWDFDVVAYSDDTTVEIFELTTAAKEDSGKTAISFPGALKVRQSLNRGEDLFAVHGGAGNNVSRAGHSYRVLASKPVTLLYGALDRRVRDGGGYVPAENGTTVGRKFFFPAISETYATHEKEIRIVAGDAASTVTVRGKSGAGDWGEVGIYELGAFGHADIVGRDVEALRNASLIEVTATEPVNVFYADWLETGAVGTSDVYTFVSALDNLGSSDIGQEFVAYLGPPGREDRVAGVEGTFSHLFFSALRDGTTVRVRDVDTDGLLLDRTVVLENRDDVHDFRVTVSEYNTLNDRANGVRPYLRVDSDEPIALAMNNWNDNWMAFASGLNPADLKVTVDAPEEVTCDRDETFVVRVENAGLRTARDVQLQTEGVGGTQIISGGSPNFIEIAAGAAVSADVVARIDCASATTGELGGIGVAASSENEEFEVTTANKETSAVPVRVPEIVGIFELSARQDPCGVELTWATEEDGDVDYVVFREEVESAGLVEIGRVSSIGVAASGFAYGFRDQTAEQLKRYRYFVRAEVGGEVKTQAGPTVREPGLPFSTPPEQTGSLSVDFAETGVIVTDPSDAEVPGFDMQAVGVAYDRRADRLYLSAAADGVFGDTDGDGDPNASSDEEMTDRADFSGDEGFAFSVDLDGDDEADALVGIPFGGDLGLLRVGRPNPDVDPEAPTLAFAPLEEDLDGIVTVELTNRPTDGSPDLEIVVNNASLLVSEDDGLGDIGVWLYAVAAAEMTAPDRVPNAGFFTATAADNRTEGCGLPSRNIHLGTFAAFGNVFAGAPAFQFASLGWTDAEDNLLKEAPRPIPGGITSSPTVFLNLGDVDIRGTLHEDALPGMNKKVRLRDYGVRRDNDFVHVAEFDHEFPAAIGDTQYESLDIQMFRMLTLDCSVTIRSTQRGTSGAMHDTRAVTLESGGVRVLENMNPALILAHSGVGTFERGGDMLNLRFGYPEDWTQRFGEQPTAQFTRYAFLDELSYHDSEDSTDLKEIRPLGEDGIEVPAGIWFINHYLWTYANVGVTRVETVFTPGPDCGASL